MKLIDADKLIAEIERRIKQNEVLPHRYIRLDEDKQLLSFITSLQQEHALIFETMRKKDRIDEGFTKFMQKKQEQPEADLDKEIVNEWKKCNPIDEGMGLESANIVNEQFDYIVRHFYKLGFNAGKKK